MNKLKFLLIQKFRVTFKWWVFNTNIEHISQIIASVPPAGLSPTLRHLGDAVKAPDVPGTPDVLIPHVSPDAGHIVAGV